MGCIYEVTKYVTTWFSRKKTHVSHLHLANHYVTALPLGYVFIGKCPKGAI